MIRRTTRHVRERWLDDPAVLGGLVAATLLVGILVGVVDDPAQVTVNWLMLSALYALVAAGFTLIFGVAGVLNLAHGASITIGAFVAFYLTRAGLSIWPAAVVAAVVAGLFSAALYLGMVRYVQEHPVIVLILTLVVALVVEQVILVRGGSQAVLVPSLVDGRVSFGDVAIGANRVLVFVLSWVLIAGLFWFVTRTRWGMAILATSMSHRGAALVGIEADRVYAYTWLVAGVLAGLAGVFLASFQGAAWDMGRNPLLLSFAIVVVGGLGSIRGSVVGAYLVGLLDVLTINLLDTSLSGLAPLVALVVVLLIRPQGLFGREFVE